MMAGMSIDPAIGLLLVCVIALLFGSAALHKVRDLKVFAGIFAAYGVAGPVSRWRLSWVVPVLELVTAAGLLADATRLYAALLGAALLVSYALAIGINLRRGRRDLACGCGGPDERRPIAPWMVWRNVLLALAVLGTLAPWSGRPLGVTDGVTVVFGVLTLALIYLCVDQLMGYLQRVAQLRGIR
jgi:Methylamine utilisation protein MauE